MRIVVTGANGYLGQGVVKQLLDDGHTVIAVDFAGTFVDSRAIVKACDMFQVEDPYTSFDCPDVLLHMAWRNGFVHNDESHMLDLPKHYSFIQKFVDGGVKHVAVMGTMHEVGFFEGCSREDTPTHPMNLYGISKDALRNAVKLLCEQNQCIFQWLRGFYIVGNAAHGNSIFSKIYAAAQNGQETFPFTTGQNQQDFIDYQEFCVQVAAAVAQDEVNGIINICNGRPEKLADRVERFIQENGFAISLDYGKFPDRKYDSKAVWGDSEKIMKILDNRRSN